MNSYKIVTVLGTRPELIRLSRALPKLSAHAQNKLVFTGQNYEYRLSRLFFEELNVPEPDYMLGVKGKSAADQIGQVLARCDDVFETEKPDRVLLLGDTNSSLCSIVAKRRGIPVFHMEAGNRCYDDRVPEEVNRRVIDHSSDILLPYTERSRRNLVAEGIEDARIFVTGNPIHEVLQHFMPQIEKSAVLTDLGLSKGAYILVTLHRAENVDIEERLRVFVSAFDNAARTTHLPVVVSTHPRTRDKIASFGIALGDNVRYAEPFGFFDFVQLEKNARCVLTDSGTVQEECCILGVPTVTLRDTTERPETVECGSNILSGCDEDRIRSCIETALELSSNWTPPPEYLAENVSNTVTRILASHFDWERN